jgi:hypothetical protein
VPALIADISLSGLRVVRELNAIIRWRGRPPTIVSDNVLRAKEIEKAVKVSLFASMLSLHDAGQVA